jgi:hypothetical protein
VSVTRLAAITLFVFTTLLASPTQSLAQTRGFDLVRLMELLSRAPGVEVPYTETKYSSLLAEPIVSSGILSYRPPDTVEKSMTAPRKERFRIAGEALIVVRNGAERRLPLSSQPLLSAFAASLRGVLAGDATLLRSFYRLELEGEEQGWQLVMIPLEVEISRYVERITVSGRGGRIEQIEVREASGDRSVLSVLQAP